MFRYFIIMQPTIQIFEGRNIRLLPNFRTGSSFFGLLTVLNLCIVGGVNFSFSFLLLGIALGNHQVNACWFSIIIISGFGPSSFSPALNRSSERFPVAKRIRNSTYHLVSVCVVLAHFLGLARHGVLAEMRLCLNLGCSFAFLPGDFTRLRASP